MTYKVNYIMCSDGSQARVYSTLMGEWMYIGRVVYYDPTP